LAPLIRTLTEPALREGLRAARLLQQSMRHAAAVCLQCQTAAPGARARRAPPAVPRACAPRADAARARAAERAARAHRERKNVNLPGVVVDLPTLTSKDEDDLVKWGLPNDIDFIAASFVRKGSDLDYIRQARPPRPLARRLAGERVQRADAASPPTARVLDCTPGLCTVIG